MFALRERKIDFLAFITYNFFFLIPCHFTSLLSSKVFNFRITIKVNRISDIQSDYLEIFTSKLYWVYSCFSVTRLSSLINVQTVAGLILLI